MILVTGSTGIVGTRLLFDLIKSGKRVRALKRHDSDTDFVKRVFHFYDSKTGGEFYEKINWCDGDITDIDSLEKAFNGIDTCYHAAALVSYDPRDEEMLIEINAEGTEKVVNVALEAGVKKICHISSVAALGRAEVDKLTSEYNHWNRDQNSSSYGLSKFMAEREIWRGTAEGLPAIVVNPSIILGPSKPNQSSGMLMSVLHKGIGFYPKGKAGYVDVRDVSKACIALMNSEIVNKRHLINSENLSYNKLLNKAANIFGNKPPKYKLKPWMLTIAWIGAKVWGGLTGSRPKVTRETAKSASSISVFDNSKIKQTLGIEFISVEESLEYYRSFFG